MNKCLLILSAILLVFLLGAQTPQLAQDTSTGPTKYDQERHSVAIGLLRTINTAEVGELSTYGAYSSWPTLLGHQPKYLDEWFARFSEEDPKGHFGDMPEIVHVDGKGYDLMLQDLTDKTCWYAALTDESGVIRQSKAIDCKI
jgi:hypothetical protein